MDNIRLGQLKRGFLNKFKNFITFENPGSDLKAEQERIRNKCSDTKHELTSWLDEEWDATPSDKIYEKLKIILELEKLDVEINSFFKNSRKLKEFLPKLHRLLKTVDADGDIEEPLRDILTVFNGLNFSSTIRKQIPSRLLSYWAPQRFIVIVPHRLDYFLQCMGEDTPEHLGSFDVEDYKKVLGTMEMIKNSLSELRPIDMIDMELFYMNAAPDVVDQQEKLVSFNRLVHRPECLNTIIYGPPGTGKTFTLIERYSKMFEKDGVKRWEMVTFHQSYGYEEFVEGLKPVVGTSGQVTYSVVDGLFKKMVRKAMDDHSNDYALLIDEINRANLSKVLGELITLLEEDKRLTWDKDRNCWKGNYRLKLPYSHAWNHEADEDAGFGVPDNLYIVGAMNTADKSIAVLDTALRRRFEFLELMPDPSALKGFEEDGKVIDLGKLLESMNRRISALYDREHQIGHSYFLRVDSLKELEKVFIKKIIPLLQEYFFDDWERIKLVLRDNTENPILKQIQLDINRELPGFSGAAQPLYEKPKRMTLEQILNIY